MALAVCQGWGEGVKVSPLSGHADTELATPGSHSQHTLHNLGQYPGTHGAGSDICQEKAILLGYKSLPDTLPVSQLHLQALI